MGGVKVIVTTSSYGKADDAPLRTLKDAGLDPVLNPFGRKLTEAEVSKLIADEKPAGMVAGVEPLTAAVLESASGLKVVSRCGIGLDSVDLGAAARLGIRVMNTPDPPARAVAELTLGFMLALLRRMAEADRNLRGGEWKALMGRLLGAQTVGIIGCGRIGSRVAALCHAFGARVIGYDPVVRSIGGVEMLGLDEVVSQSDVLSLHVPYSDETRNLMDGDMIAAMKDGAVLINASRGGLVDEAALYDALSSGRLGGAGIDSYETEPYTGPLTELDNALLTAHMGSYASEARLMMEREAADNLVSGLKNTGVI